MYSSLCKKQYTARVEISKALAAVAFGDVGVSAEQNISRLQGRGIIGGEEVTVGGKDAKPIDVKKCIVGKDGEGKYHLVDLCLAVSAHAK